MLIENPRAPTPDIVLKENPNAPPRRLNLAEKPKAPAPTSAEQARSEEEGCRRDLAIHLVDRSTANKASGKHVMPNVMIQCRRCKTHVDLAPSFSMVCAAGIVDSFLPPRQCQHDNLDA